MKKLSMFVYSIFAYLLAFASIILWILSVSNLVPEISIDGEAVLPLHWALLKNLGLVMLFGLQHSIMARKSFKERISRIIPEPIERSTFVLISGLLLIALVLNWEPMGGEVWTVAEDSFLSMFLTIVFFIGWAILFISTFIINHFDLFGLRQTYLELTGKSYTELDFQVKGFYKYVRHPLYFGGIVGLWATPVMTVTHLVFALGLTLYFVIGTLFEERDLISRFGDTYRDYKKQTAMLLPYPKSKFKSVSIKKYLLALGLIASVQFMNAQYAYVDFDEKESTWKSSESEPKSIHKLDTRNAKYADIFDKTNHFPTMAKLAHEMISAYKLEENEQYDSKEPSSYHLTFRGAQFVAQVSYDSQGRIVQTRERFDDIAVPMFIRKEILQRFDGWELKEAIFSFRYSMDGKSKGLYVVQLCKGPKNKWVKWEVL